MIVSDIAPKELLGLSGGLFNPFANAARIVTPLVIGLIVSAMGSFVLALALISLVTLIGALTYIFFVAGDLKRIEIRLPSTWAPAAGWPAAAVDGTVRIWPARAAAHPRCSTTAEPCAPWPGPPTAGWPAAAADGKVRIWPAEGGGPPQVLDHGGTVYALAWAPGGRLASGGSDGKVRIWRVSGQSDQLPGLQLPESEFRFDRSCDALAVWSDRIACATAVLSPC